MSNSECDLHSHFGSEPNDRDGMSVIELSTPAMCSGVSGDARERCRHSARAHTSCIATFECFAASRCTQWTVGELSLNNATCASSTVGHTSSMTSQRRRRPAISRSKFVMRPVGFDSDTMSLVMSAGHWNQNTVGGTALFSPTTHPPTPYPDASVIPT